MKFFGWKSAGREVSRPVLSRGFSTWAGANNLGEWPRAYEPQVRDGYIGNPVAQRAVRLVAESVGSAPVLASDPAALALIVAKSGGQSLIETMAMHLLLHGNAYVQVLSDDAARPRELFALRPERVTVEADARGWPAAFLYKAGTAVTRLAAEDARGHAAVIHVKTAHPLDDHYGLGCLGAAAGAIAIHNAATRWNKALLDNAARPSGALVYEPGEPGAVLAAEQFARLRTELDASFAGAGNAGRPMLLEGGLKWQSLSLSPADMDFVGLKASAAREIALAFGVPPMLLGLPGDATYANYREANKALWRLSVLPMAGLILEGIAQGLRPHFAGLTLAIDPDKVSALSEDRERLWAQVEAASFLTLNEKRAAVGFAAIEVPKPVVAPEPEPKVAEPATAEEAAPVEVKFNPWHDPDDGKFTFAGQGMQSGGGDHDAPARLARRPSSAPVRAAGAGTTPSAKREKPSAHWKRLSSAERLADPKFKAAAQFHAIAQRAVLSGQERERFIYGVGEGPDGQLSRLERPISAEIRGQVAATLERLVKKRLDKGGGFPPVTEAELRRGDTPTARAYATLVKTAVVNAYNDRERQALTFFIGKGWQPHQAVAIVASLKKESFLDPGAVQGGGPGRGIAQWTDGDSRAATYVRLHPGKSILTASFTEQLEFVNHELHNPTLSRQKTLTDGGYQRAGNKLRKSVALTDAVMIVVNEYERPGARGQVAERQKIAKEIYDYWSRVKGFFPATGG